MRKQIALKVGQVEYDAVDVNITGRDVYVNHKGPNTGTHNSYHASGQEHIKIGRRYVKVTGLGLKDAELKWYRARPGTVVTRESLAPFGWEKSQILALPHCGSPAEVAFDVTQFVERGIVGLLVSIVGLNEPERDQIDEICSVIGRHRFTDNITVEVEAFLLE